MENKKMEVNGKEYKAIFMGTVEARAIYLVYTEKSHYELFETAKKGTFTLTERNLKGYRYFETINDIIVPIH
jgi:hypothetical protein